MVRQNYSDMDSWCFSSQWNYKRSAKTSFALLELKTFLLKENLSRKIKPEELYNAIQSCPNLTTGKNKLRLYQLKICFLPPPELPDYDKFDEKLLDKLIQHLFSLPKIIHSRGTEEHAKATLPGDHEHFRLLKSSASWDQEINRDIAELCVLNKNRVYSRKSFKRFWTVVSQKVQRIVNLLNLTSSYQEQLVKIGRYSFTDTNTANLFIILMMNENNKKGNITKT